ncbi:asparaginase, partial [Streptomyces sp. 15-116A]|nr:asparaginase [Streptomyces sp. 15-116A]
LARAGVDPAALAAFEGQPLLGGGRPVGSVRPVPALAPPVAAHL